MMKAASLDPKDLARAVLEFWFVDHNRKDWFARNAAFDAEIRDRFSAAHDAASAGRLDQLRADRDGALALILILDQFSRNLFRDTPRAFEQDARAREVARDSIEAGFDMATPDDRRAFFYIPFMHSESLADQEYCVALFKERLPGSYNERYAVDHCEIIRRFGRFPHRNRILGRPSTPEEIAYLESGGFNP